MDEKQIDIDDFEKNNIERLALFEQYGVRDLVAVYVLDTNPIINFDVLIVDREHVNISITSSKAGKRLHSGIAFENHPQLASAYAEWFDNSVLSLAKPIEQWLKEQRSK